MKFPWMIYCPGWCLTISVQSELIPQTKPELILLIEVLHTASKGIHLAIRLFYSLWIKGSKTHRDRSGEGKQTELKWFGLRVEHVVCWDFYTARRHHMNTLGGRNTVKHPVQVPRINEEVLAVGPLLSQPPSLLLSSSASSDHRHVCSLWPRVWWGWFIVDGMINVAVLRCWVRLMLPTIPSMPNLLSLQ